MISGFEELRDSKARAIIRERIARLALGLVGDAKALGDSVFELRISFGPGYRIYYAESARTIVVLLCAGTKRTQQVDIERAKLYWADYRRLTENA